MSSWDIRTGHHCGSWDILLGKAGCSVKEVISSLGNHLFLYLCIK